MLPGQACSREKRDKDEKLFIQQRRNKSHDKDLTALVCQMAKSALFLSRCGRCVQKFPQTLLLLPVLILVSLGSHKDHLRSILLYISLRHVPITSSCHYPKDATLYALEKSKKMIKILKLEYVSRAPALICYLLFMQDHL